MKYSKYVQRIRKSRYYLTDVNERYVIIHICNEIYAVFSKFSDKKKRVTHWGISISKNNKHWQTKDNDFGRTQDYNDIIDKLISGEFYFRFKNTLFYNGNEKKLLRDIL